jgi:3-hydroxybutyryl-CoA dehydratase
MVMSEGEVLSHFLEDLTVGQSASFERAISEADVREFALMSGDFNPVHLDEAYAQATRFKGRIVHGMLPVTFLSTVLGTRLPGAGAIFMGASFRFKAPVRIGDTVVATCTVREINAPKGRVTFDCVCMVGDTVVVEGDALVKVPSREAQEKAPAETA